MPTKFKSFVFKIPSISSYEGKPTRRDLSNELDYASDIVTTKRLSGESNVDFRNRVLDVTVHPGGPTETGIINGLSRDLGFIRKPAFTIDVDKDAGGVPWATAPRVVMLANRIILYSDWRPDGTAVIDKEIRIYQPEDTGYYLDDLIAEINTSSYFTATIDPDVRPNLLSTLLVRDDSINIIFGDFVGMERKIYLVGDFIVKDSVVFDSYDISFTTEVASSPPTAVGEYYIDYTNGTIELYREPEIENTVNYYHNVFPMEIDWTPIQLFSLNDDDFVDELFIMETLQSGEEVRGLPNAEGSDIYHTLFKETNNLWGK